MAKDYRYGFEFAESGGRKIIRYRQDKLWFKPGLGWWIFFQLIAAFFLLSNETMGPYSLPWAALGVLAYRRSRMREISVGEQDVVIKGKRYDRSKITQLFVENHGDKQTYSYQAQNYDQVARDAANNPLGGDPVLARAGAMAGDLSRGIAMLSADAINSTGKKARMVYDGKTVVFASWLSVQRAMMLTNALGSYLGFSMDDRSTLGSDLWTPAAKNG